MNLHLCQKKVMHPPPHPPKYELWDAKVDKIVTILES
jgi:hypothetical protein